MDRYSAIHNSHQGTNEPIEKGHNDTQIHGDGTSEMNEHLFNPYQCVRVWSQEFPGQLKTSSLIYKCYYKKFVWESDGMLGLDVCWFNYLLSHAHSFQFATSRQMLQKHNAE